MNPCYVNCVLIVFCVGKVKTTNPKKYCVRPNAGVVLPGSSCNVTGNDISFYLSSLLNPYFQEFDGDSIRCKQQIMIELSLYQINCVDFVVTMQAQKEAPPDMQCKDKFLIQSVIAPSGTSNKDITTEMVSCLQPFSGSFSIIVY